MIKLQINVEGDKAATSIGGANPTVGEHLHLVDVLAAAIREQLKFIGVNCTNETGISAEKKK